MKRHSSWMMCSAVATVVLPLVVPTVASAHVSGCNPQVIDLGTLGGTSSEILEANARGMWVGSSRTAEGVNRAVIWGPGGIRDLGTRKGESEGDDINNRGIVVGNQSSREPDIGRAFIWRRGVLRNLPTLPGGGGTFVRRLNERGDATGSATDRQGIEHPVVWLRGRHLVKLPVPAGYLGAYGMAVNDRGDVVGGAFKPRKLVAWGWDKDGSNHPLAEIDLHGFSQANVLDNRGRAAGISDFGGNPGAQASLWQDGRERSLGVFGDSDFSFALGTNGQGDYVGVGDYFLGAGEGHVFLTSASWHGPLRTLMPLSGDPSDESGAHAATGGNVSVGGHSYTADGEKHATVWTCAYKQAFVPDVELTEADRQIRPGVSTMPPPGQTLAPADLHGWLASR